jgi:hypothetical protein
LDCLPENVAAKITADHSSKPIESQNSKPGFIEWRKPFPVNPPIPIRQTKLHLRKLHWAEYRAAWTACRENATAKLPADHSSKPIESQK